MADNKTYNVFDTFEGLHEYVIEETTTKKGFRRLTLKHSNGEHWSSHVRGKKILSMTTTGNGVKFSKPLKSLDYDLLVEFRILINFEHQTDPNELNHAKYKILENFLTV